MDTENKNKRKLKVSYSWFTSSLRSLFKDFFNLRNGADIEGTAENIKKDAQFKGYSLWILIFSIFIASIGLNLNSAAVIIGAMLISPLMGPIQGIGLSLGTNDFETLLSSIRNLIIMVVVSLITSFVFFSLSPFQEAQSELLGRTKPHLFDAFVAIFGGLSGIIGGSRFDRGNVIPGVAIATALMPPLCTAGYGLATHQMSYFWGASYLFLINSAFICISTIIVVKYLRIPIVRYVNPKKEKQIRLIILFLAVIVIIPSLITLISVSSEYKNQNQIKAFVRHEMNYKKSLVFETNYSYNIDSIPSYQVIYNKWFNKSKQLNSKVQFFITGESLDSLEENRLKSILPTYVSNTTLELLQPKDRSYEFLSTIDQLEDKSQVLDKAYEQVQQELLLKNQKIEELSLLLDSMSKDTLPITELQRSISTFYPNIQSIDAGYLSGTDDRDVVSVVLHWDNNWVSYKNKKEMTNNVEKWIKSQINKDSIVILNH